MPEYLYLCEKTNQEFEAVHSINDELKECPICKEQNKEQHAPKRLIAGAANFILGSGGVGWAKEGYNSR